MSQPGGEQDVSAMVQELIMKSIKDLGVKETLGTKAAQSLTVFLGAPLFDHSLNRNPDVFVVEDQFGFFDPTRNVKCFFTYPPPIDVAGFINSQKESFPTYGEIIQRIGHSPIKFVAESGTEWCILQGTDVAVLVHNAFIGHSVLQQKLAIN